MDPSRPKMDSVMDPVEGLLGDLYAQALLETAPDNADAEELSTELEGILSILDQIDGAKELLSGELLNAEDRAALVERVFAGRVSPKIESFLAVLDRHGRMNALQAVVRSFRKQLNAREGKVEVTLTTAVALEPPQQGEVEKEIQSALGAQPLLRTRVDEDLLGGAVLRIGDRVYDASILSQLRRMKEMIAAKRGQLK